MNYKLIKQTEQGELDCGMMMTSLIMWKQFIFVLEWDNDR